jgi:hypothetical protein
VFPLRTVLHCRPLKEIQRSGFYTCALTMACSVINDSRWIIVLFGSYSDIRGELLVHTKPVRIDTAVSCISYSDNVIWSIHFNQNIVNILQVLKRSLMYVMDWESLFQIHSAHLTPPPKATPVVLFRKFSKISGQPADLQKCNYQLRNAHPHITLTAPL